MRFCIVSLSTSCSYKEFGLQPRRSHPLKVPSHRLARDYNQNETTCFYKHDSSAPQVCSIPVSPLGNLSQCWMWSAAGRGAAICLTYHGGDTDPQMTACMSLRSASRPQKTTFIHKKTCKSSVVYWHPYLVFIFYFLYKYTPKIFQKNFKLLAPSHFGDAVPTVATRSHCFKD